MSDYYEPQERPGVDEQLAESGWRREVGQLVRFEAALAPWDWEAIDSVLDLGCGPARLADYMAETGRSATYLGIERRESAAEYARDHLPEGAEVRVGDLYDAEVVDESFDLVVAIGAQVDGTPPADEGDRVARVRRLVERCHLLADKAASVVVLDQSVLEARPALGLEPALFGVTDDEITEILQDVAQFWGVQHRMLETDHVAHIDRASVRRAESRVTVCERAIDVHLAGGGTREDAAWVWLETHRPDRALRELVKLVESTGMTDEIRHLFDRLEQAIAPD